MDRYENMRIFIRVVEAGSISGAAEQLAVAKSAVSRRLKELEEHLKVELFRRTTRRMNLTDTGEAFYQKATRILEDIHEAEMSVSKAHGTLKGRLKVTLPSSFGNLHMSDAISDFLKLHPHIEFEIDFNDRKVDLIQEGFDLAVRIGELQDSTLIARKLAPISIVTCASPMYLQLWGKPTAPEELKTHHCITYTLVENPKAWYYSNAQGEETKVMVNSRLKSSSGEFLMKAAIEGHGVVNEPTFIIYPAIESGQLVTILNDYTSRQLNAYAVYPQTRHLSQRVRVFVDFLVERFAGTPYWDECLALSEK